MYEIPAELKPQPRWYGGWSGGGGLGGAVGGGFGLGGGGGGGSFGGGGFVSGQPQPRQAREPTQTESQLDLIRDTDTEPESTNFDVPETASEIAESNASIFRQPRPVRTNDQETTNFVMQETDGLWEEIDGSGGGVQWHAPTLSFVVRQTYRVHAEIAQILERLRKLPAAGDAVLPARRPRIDARDRRGWDLQPLTDIIVGSTAPGRWHNVLWEDIDGSGGTISPHLPSLSLVIRQSPVGHHEIQRLLHLLRHERIGWGDGTRLPFTVPGNRSSFAIDRPDWPSELTSDETRLLREHHWIRDGTLWETWLRKRPGQAVERVQFVRRGTQLTTQLGRQTFRVDGDRVEVLHHDLSLVATDKDSNTTGESVRRMLDSRLQWLPHRSAQKLGRPFDARTLPDGRLKLGLQGDPESSLTLRVHPTGVISDYEAVTNGEVQYRLQFDDPRLTAPSEANADDLIGNSVRAVDGTDRNSNAGR